MSIDSGPEDGGGQTESPPSRGLIDGAKRLLRQARRLLRKGKGRVSNEVFEQTSALVQEIEERIGAQPISVGTDQLCVLLTRLDDLLGKHFGRWRKGPLRRFLEPVFWSVVVALFIRAFLLQMFVIPTDSMTPTLQVGDSLLVNKVSYGLYMPFTGRRVIQWGQPERGDIVVFERTTGGKDYIKRIIGAPGDRVRVSQSVVYVNGHPITGETTHPISSCSGFRTATRWEPSPGECTCIQRTESIGGGDDTTRWQTPYVIQHLSSDCGPARPNWPIAGSWPSQEDRSVDGIQVPPGHVFVMGDNRDHSSDSRFWGFARSDHIKGVAVVIWYARTWRRVMTWL